LTASFLSCFIIFFRFHPVAAKKGSHDLSGD
jgi:hypothetical protein